MEKGKELYGKYGTLAKKHLEEHEPARCWVLGKDLPAYLHGIDRQAEELYETIYAKLSVKDEYKKTGEYLSDVRKENEMRQRIEEEILSELVYVLDNSQVNRHKKENKVDKKVKFFWGGKHNN